MALVNFRKTFDVRIFPRRLRIRGTKFFGELSKNFFSVHFGILRWVPRQSFKI
jgi:hypothetical protein